jgi:hypothetical protein
MDNSTRAPGAVLFQGFRLCCNLQLPRFALNAEAPLRQHNPSGGLSKDEAPFDSRHIEKLGFMFPSNVAMT